MGSGIGAYAPLYMQEGGPVPGLSGAQGRNGRGINVSTPFGNITLTAEQLAAAQGAGYQGAVNASALPNYLTVEGSLVRISPTASNLQFINFLNDLGLFSDQEYDGLTDYEWFVQAVQDNPDQNWMASLFNDPNKDFLVDDNFLSNTNYSETNIERFRRLANLMNPASQSGGAFEASPLFLSNYGGGLGLNANRGDTQAARPRQVFIGQRPTGLGLDPNTGQPSAQQPFYTLSDILVDSSEQPNLYTYGGGQFNPMNTTATANPYLTPVSGLSTSYTTPTTSTPTYTSDVNFENIFADVVTPDKVRDFYLKYLGRDPGPNEYVMQFVDSGKTLDEIEQEIMSSPEAQNFAITGVPVSSAEELAAITNERMAVTPDKVRAFYQMHLGRDPGPNEYVMGWVNSGMSLQDIENAIIASPEGQNFLATGVPAVAASTPEVSLQSVQDLYQKNLGRQGAEEYVMNWVNSGMSLSEIDQAIQNSPEGLAYASSLTATTPAGTTGTATVVDQPSDQVTSDAVRGFYRKYLGRDPGANEYVMSWVNSGQSLGEIEQGIAGSVEAQNFAASQEQKDEEDAGTGQVGSVGFATGGIVDLSGGMNLEANSGQGLESFLQSRSKAALRRNLARTAPRPTAPVPTMRQGIMPMAR